MKTDMCERTREGRWKGRPTEYVISEDCYFAAESTDWVYGAEITESDSYRAISYRRMIPYGDIIHRFQTDTFTGRYARNPTLFVFSVCLDAGLETPTVPTPLSVMAYSRNCRPERNKAFGDCQSVDRT